MRRKTEQMDREQAYVLLNDIIQDVIGGDLPSLCDASTAADLPGWDSLFQISLLAAVEIRFGVEIRSAEADRLRTVGQLVDLILDKVPRLPAA